MDSTSRPHPRPLHFPPMQKWNACQPNDAQRIFCLQGGVVFAWIHGLDNKGRTHGFAEGLQRLPRRQPNGNDPLSETGAHCEYACESCASIPIISNHRSLPISLVSFRLPSSNNLPLITFLCSASGTLFLRCHSRGFLQSPSKGYAGNSWAFVSGTAV